MAGTGDESTTDTRSSGPPTTVYIYPGGKSRCTIVAIEQLARLVAALPLQHFLPLHSAFAQAKDRLGSYSLAARDLTQYARARRLTVAVRVIRNFRLPVRYGDGASGVREFDDTARRLAPLRRSSAFGSALFHDRIE
jgi:hypothetical protein